MLQTRVRDGQNSADSSLQHDAWFRNTVQTIALRPAILLAFFVAVVGLAWLVSARISADKNLELPISVQQDGGDDLKLTDEKAQLQNELSGSSGSITVHEGTASSVKLESKTNDGVTNTKLEVNGEEIPVRPNGTTQVTVPSGSQSVTTVTTQNTQTSGSGFNFNSTTSSSFSHNSSSQNKVGGQ